MDQEAKNVRIQPPRGLVRGFASFINDYNVAPLAIGVVVGTAVNGVVNTLVEGFFTPLISLLAPRQGLQDFQWTIHGATFKVGAIVNSLLSFLIIMLIVYVVVKLLLRREELLKK